MSTLALDIETPQIIKTDDHTHDDKHYYVIINRNRRGSVARWLPMTSKADRSDENDRLNS